MPTRRLPPRPSLDHLKRQARDLLAACAAGDPTALQRLGEHHPRADAATLSWSDGLFAIAREYGFASWSRLKARVAAPGEGQLSFRDRIEDPVLRQAVDAADDGDLDALKVLLAAHADLATRRARFEGENYFRAPALLAFVAENPVRNDGLPPNVVEIARTILDAGTAPADIQETLTLVASGRVVREAGAQEPLIELLVARGADPAAALDAALAHGEFAAVGALLRLGAAPTLATATALDELADASLRLGSAAPAERHLALALAAQFGRTAILKLLLEAGEDPSRFNPLGAHAHSTPLHQAAWAGRTDAVRLLLAHGARRDLRDTLWNGTAADWARHAGRPEIAALLDEA